MRAVMLAAALVAATDAAAVESRALRDAHGAIVAVTASPAPDGTVWTRAEVAVDGNGRVILSVAPADVVGASEFRVAVGDIVRVRYFTGEQPFDVQRIRNESTGAVFRARCLHGDPLWFRGQSAREGPGGRREGAGGRGGRR